MRVKIDIISLEKRLNKAGDAFFIISSKNDKYYLWKPELAKGLGVGQTIRIDVQPGRWPRILSIEKDEAVHSPTPVGSNMETVPVPSSASSSIKYSVRGLALIASSIAFKWDPQIDQDPDMAMKRIKAYAELFEFWIMGRSYK